MQDEVCHCLWFMYDPGLAFGRGSLFQYGGFSVGYRFKAKGKG
jgi:hypothetical protein